ncbi:MAG: DUF192 domain-containing protein [Halobacteriaceae archaeon]
MEVEHRPADSEAAESLATDVEVATSAFGQGRGLMFRRSFPDGSALVMPFDRVRRRSLHSFFVFFPFEAIWVDGETVTRIHRFEPFRSIAAARADLLVELPTGVAESVSPGDRLRLTEEQG